MKTAAPKHPLTVRATLLKIPHKVSAQEEYKGLYAGMSVQGSLPTLHPNRLEEYTKHIIANKCQF